MSAHQLLRLKSEVFNKPQLMHLTEFNDIVDYLNNGRSLESIQTNMFLDNEDDEQPQGKYPSFVTMNEDTSTAVIDFSGTLTYKPMFDMATCGMGLSYQTLKSVFTDLVLEDGIKNISMIVNSGGGQAHGCFDSANFVKELLQDNGASLTAYVDGGAFSAAYAWIAIADEIVMSKDSEVGSIGVVIQLMNNSKALEKEGYERSFVYSGDAKIAFDESGAFSKEFIASLQESCDEQYEEFINHVSLHRNIDKELVRGTQANTFNSKDALTLGLADKVMTYEQFMDYLASKSPNKEAHGLSKGYLGRFLNSKKQDQQEMSEMSELKQMQEELTKTLVEKETVEASMSAMAAQVAEMQTQLESFKGLVAEKEALELAAKEALAASEVQAAALAQEAAEKAVALRKEQLGSVLAADQVEAQMEALSSLDDTQFSAVIATFTSMKSKAVDSALMQEVGDEGTAVEHEPKSDMDQLEQLTKQYL